mmetsp:Transcript_61897/g.147419  ORF Transcript_61897/g.147419 Transcript_61897/m.147419 type:complete len:200 (-) Transcript_61897:319-918(-)
MVLIAFLCSVRIPTSIRLIATSSTSMTDLRAFQSCEAKTPCSRSMYKRAIFAETPSGHTSIMLATAMSSSLRPWNWLLPRIAMMRVVSFSRWPLTAGPEQKMTCASASAHPCWENSSADSIVWSSGLKKTPRVGPPSESAVEASGSSVSSLEEALEPPSPALTRTRASSPKAVPMASRTLGSLSLVRFTKLATTLASDG